MQEEQTFKNLDFRFSRPTYVFVGNVGLCDDQEQVAQQQLELEKQKAGERKAVSEATAAMEARVLEGAQQASARAREMQDRITGLENDLKASVGRC